MPPIKVDPNGEFEVEQMYVQYVKLAKPKGKVPLLLWHGGGLSGVTWETKPDGKPGWQQFFLNAGYDTYVSDAVERGRASWARYPGDLQERAVLPHQEGGVGAVPHRAELRTRRGARCVRGSAVPGRRVRPFHASRAFRAGLTNDAATQKAYDALVQKVCPCIIVVHSQGGNFGFKAALNAPDKVKALIAIEPSGAPDPAKVDAAKVKGVPHLVVWGDFHDKHPVWPKIRPNPEKWAAAIKAAGGTADTFDLPKMGIKGNTHMLMMDKNSDDIAKLVRTGSPSRGW